MKIIDVKSTKRHCKVLYVQGLLSIVVPVGSALMYILYQTRCVKEIIVANFRTGVNLVLRLKF